MGFPKRYDTSPSANKRQFSPTFRKPGGKKCEKWAFFGSYFEKCRIWRSMRKYKLCTPLDASCQGASFATLLGCLVGHRAEKTSKNLLKKRVGHFVRSLRSQNAEVAVWDLGHVGVYGWMDYPALTIFNFDPQIFSTQRSKSKICFDHINWLKTAKC